MMGLALLQTSLAEDAYRISIIKGDHEPKLSKEQIAQLSQTGISSLDQLSIVFCAADAKTKSDPSNAFQVVIENTRKKEATIRMTQSDWYACVTFYLVDDAKKSYSISRGLVNLSKNTLETWTIPPGGKRMMSVSFCDGSWNGLPLAPKRPVIVKLTATFEYYDEKGASISLNSKPTAVILMAK